MISVELFAGAGGLAMGVADAGFTHTMVIERDKHSCNTIRYNQVRGMTPLVNWPLYEGDVHDFNYATLEGEVDLLAGGPPCQPFSLGGKHRGQADERNLFPEAVRAVRELRPRAFLFENVKGLVRESFMTYFEYIILQLTYPEIAREENQDWREHLATLEQSKTRGARDALQYNVLFQTLNAANYGVPQKRDRVIIVGFRSDLGVEWSFPPETHSRVALIRSQWVTGEYWDRHRISRRNRPAPPPRLEKRIARLRSDDAGGAHQPWLTVRDAISDLPDPVRQEREAAEINHCLIPGARAYPGHTGSPLDEPAKALKAGDHGVPGGENMLAYPDGSVRYFTVRESARLQAFPDSYLFNGTWGENMRQLGNAVPVTLGRIVADSIRERLAQLNNADAERA